MSQRTLEEAKPVQNEDQDGEARRAEDRTDDGDLNVDVHVDLGDPYVHRLTGCDRDYATHLGGA